MAYRLYESCFLVGENPTLPYPTYSGWRARMTLVWPNQNGIPGGSNHVSSVIFLSSVYLVRQFAPFREPGTRSCPIFFSVTVFLGHTLRYLCKGDSYPLSSPLLIGLLFEWRSVAVSTA